MAQKSNKNMLRTKELLRYNKKHFSSFQKGFSIPNDDERLFLEGYVLAEANNSSDSKENGKGSLLNKILSSSFSLSQEFK